MRRIMLLASIVLAFVGPRAIAQADLKIMTCGEFGFHSFPFGGAIANLGLQDQTTPVPRHDEDALLDALRSQQWDLVIIRWFRAFEGPLAGEVIDELAAHVDAGGKLIFSMAQLDEQPEVWPILGIEGAVDLEEPLQDVVTSFGIGDPAQRHPAFGGARWPVSDDPFLPMTSDYGDELSPSAGSFAFTEYQDSGTAAMVMSEGGRVIVNGPHWDYWSAASTGVAEQQIRWLLGCPADLDGDGELTVFDFVEFQNRFDSGGVSGFADFNYDGRLDIFDFLEFFNLFEQGC